MKNTLKNNLKKKDHYIIYIDILHGLTKSIVQGDT